MASNNIPSAGAVSAAEKITNFLMKGSTMSTYEEGESAIAEIIDRETSCGEMATELERVKQVNRELVKATQKLRDEVWEWFRKSENMSDGLKELLNSVDTALSLANVKENEND